MRSLARMRVDRACARSKLHFHWRHVDRRVFCSQHGSETVRILDQHSMGNCSQTFLIHARLSDFFDAFVQELKAVLEFHARLQKASWRLVGEERLAGVRFHRDSAGPS